MIGRGAYGRPWLLGQVMAALRGEAERPDAGLDEQYDVITTHYRAMIDHYGEMTGVNMARKHLGWYVKGLHGSVECRNKVNQSPASKGVTDGAEGFYGRSEGRRVGEEWCGRCKPRGGP